MTTNEVVKLNNKVDAFCGDDSGDLVLLYNTAKGVRNILKKMNLKYEPLDKHLIHLVMYIFVLHLKTIV